MGRNRQFILLKTKKKTKGGFTSIEELAAISAASALVGAAKAPVRAQTLSEPNPELVPTPEPGYIS